MSPRATASSTSSTRSCCRSDPLMPWALGPHTRSIPTPESVFTFRRLPFGIQPSLAMRRDIWLGAGVRVGGNPSIQGARGQAHSRTWRTSRPRNRSSTDCQPITGDPIPTADLDLFSIPNPEFAGALHADALRNWTVAGLGVANCKGRGFICPFTGGDPHRAQAPHFRESDPS